MISSNKIIRSLRQILILFFFLGTFTLVSQSKIFRGGITLGLVASDVNGASITGNNNNFSKVGINAGGLINTHLSERTIFQLEVNYIQKGHLDRPDSLNNGYSKIALHYVEVPFMLKQRVKFNMRKKPVNRIDLEGGFSVGRLLQYTIIGQTNYKIYSGPELFNFYDVSLLLGADYNISENVYFCLRYSNSIIPVIKKNTPNLYFITYTFNRGNNMVVHFTFKFLFGGKKPDTETPTPATDPVSP